VGLGDIMRKFIANIDNFKAELNNNKIYVGNGSYEDTYDDNLITISNGDDIHEFRLWLDDVDNTLLNKIIIDIDRDEANKRFHMKFGN
jgi:hypothetical protein